MKTYIQEEGFDFSGDRYFGDITEYLREYHFIVQYKVRGYDINNFQVVLYYGLTEDGYIQICSVEVEGKPKIIAQFKRTDEGLKNQISSIFRMYLMETRYFSDGPPDKYIDGAVFAKEEFEKFLEDIYGGLESNRMKALEDPPEMVSLCKEFDLWTQPDGKDTETWMCTCPRCRRTFLTFTKNSDFWYCMFCNISGNGQLEFRKKIAEIRDKMKLEEQEHLAEKKKQEEEKAAALKASGQSDAKKTNSEYDDSHLTEEERRWLFWLSNY